MKSVIIALVLVCSPAFAAEQSASISVEQARSLVAGVGVNSGTVFRLGDGRYAISKVEISSHRKNTFSIELEIKPMPKSE
jgi:hypothetical protein